MDRNPFHDILAAMAPGAASAGPVVGRVLSWPSSESPGTPQKILAEGNTQERADLRASPGLLPYGLVSGDEVLLLPVEDRQRYIILCKVVNV